ncbi:MAG: FtsQ-type POTRA domain-containing protein [Nibricoccus sp.]
MNAPANISPPARSWRDIHQDIAPRSMSGEGRKRLAFATLKTIGIVAVLCTSLWGGYELFRLWQHDPVKLKAPVKSSPVREIVLQSDGPLDHAWIERTLALPKGIDLMEIDLYALRERLLAVPQVRTAVLARKFPDKLSVVLEERMPVARVRVPESDGALTDYLVSRDGFVFPGINYASERIETLPYLDGIKLRRSGRGFAPIEGMETVSDLLGTARANTLDLYSRWRIVSLARLATDGVIVVRSTDIPEVTFGTRDDFLKQLAQLDLIIDRTRSQPDGRTLASVNLSVGLSANGVLVPVVYAQPDPVPGAQPAASSTPSTSGRPANYIPSLQSPRNRPARSAPQRPSAFFQLQPSSPL